MDNIIKYDAKADILTMKIREGAIANEKLLDNDVLLGYDKNNELVAVEIWDASKHGLLKALVDLANEKRVIAKTILKMNQLIKQT
jgi:uncharacterized protein YuzE